MLKKTMADLALRHLEKLYCYTHEEVADFVFRMVNLQPWYFRIPMKVQLLLVAIVGIKGVPFSKMLDTFVQSTALLKFFDDPELIKKFPHAGI